MTRFGAWVNGFIQVAGTDLSNSCEVFDLDESTAELDAHGHGDQVMIKDPGLKTHGVTARFYTDMDASRNVKILRPLYDNKTIFSVIMKPASGSTTSTNPQWSGNFFLSRFKPMTGRHGDEMMLEVTFSTTTGITYSES